MTDSVHSANAETKSVQAHTPGPWLIADESKTFVYALGPHGTNSFWALVQAAGQERVSHDECKANARLMAVAPELLEALQALLADVDEVASRCGWADRGARKTARAAIAKATGATP